MHAESPEIAYFVDEAGDPTLFDRKGRIIVGEPGCSRYFMLGKLEIDDPKALSQALDALRSDLLKHPYFRGVPSMQVGQRKTALAFHAKDDLPEVRWEVYKLLMQAPVRFYAVVRDKTALATYVQQQNTRDPAYRYRPDEQYDFLVQALFEKLHHMASHVSICFAKRGTKPRNDALRAALERAGAIFARNFGFAHPAIHDVISSTPPQCPGLQAADYFLWALQRFYERREDRYLSLLWDQVGEIHDLDQLANGRRGTFYRKDKPLTLDAFTLNAES